MTVVRVEVGKGRPAEVILQLVAMEVEREDDSTGEDGGETHIDDDVLLEPQVLVSVRAHHANQLLIFHSEDLHIAQGVAGTGGLVVVVDHNRVSLLRHDHCGTGLSFEGSSCVFLLISFLPCGGRCSLPKENLGPMQGLLGRVDESAHQVLSNDEEQSLVI